MTATPTPPAPAPTPPPRNQIHHADNLTILPTLPDASIPLIYIDPPFNTGHTQHRRRLHATRDDESPRLGFRGARYRTQPVASPRYADSFADYPAFLAPRLHHAHRILAPHGSFFLHVDCHEVHYCKVLLDEIFGRASFRNEIIWAYDYGARSKTRWPAKHDNILWYTKSPTRYTFHYDAIDRIPYLAPKLAGKDKAARGKTPTDVWWQTIVSPTGKEKTGYPTQKPLVILDRIVRVHSNPDDVVLDFFAGSGTTGEAAARNGRRFLLIDDHEAAIAVMQKRLAAWL